MNSSSLLAIVLAVSVACYPAAMAQETKNSKESKPKGTLTLLGTIKGEVDKVSDGGHKIEVKFKEMVTAPSRSTTTSRTSSYAKFRLPIPKEFTLKEKNQEIEVRLLDNAVIRILEASETAIPAKGSDKKGDKAIDKKDDKSGADDDDDKSKSHQTDNVSDKSKDKIAANSSKKTAESSLPGKPGKPGSLVKGQVIIVTVLREDLPGFSRFVASTIYILGEK
jgi:hypothetical protein